METRANYVVIGLFTLAVIAGVFGFVYWFQNIGGTGERAYYRIVFGGSVGGLRIGGTVMFNGIRVGEVTDLKLNPEKPQEVITTISIDKKVAIRKDTDIGLEFAGLTGVASVSLKGGSPNLPALEGTKDNPPVLNASVVSADVTQAVRDSLRKMDNFLEENRQAFHSALDNLDKFAEALARNSERVDKITAGLQHLVAGADGKGGEIDETLKSVRRMTETGTRTLNTIDKAVKNFDKNPSRVLWGGGNSADDEAKQKANRSNAQAPQ